MDFNPEMGISNEKSLNSRVKLFASRSKADLIIESSHLITFEMFYKANSIEI